MKNEEYFLTVKLIKDFKTWPTKTLERLTNDNYRVEGSEYYIGLVKQILKERKMKPTKPTD